MKKETLKVKSLPDSETIVKPKRIYGKEYRVPVIERCHDGYLLRNLALPQNWEKAIPEMKRQEINGFATRLEVSIEGLDYEGEVASDVQTGLVTRVSLTKNGKNDKVVLDSGEHSGQPAEYKSEVISSLKTAIVFQEFLASYLWYIATASGSNEQYAFIVDGGYGRSGSANLTVPAEFMDGKVKGIIDEYNQNRFAITAANIAGQFGMTVRTPLNFDKNGVLRYFQVDPGDACDYGVGGIPKGNYVPHNVDNIWQAAALHNIGAAFINLLLDNK